MPRIRKTSTPRIRSISLHFNSAGMTAEELAGYLASAQECIRKHEEVDDDTKLYLKTYVKPSDPELLRVFNVRATCDSDVLQIVLGRKLIPPLRVLHSKALDRLTAPKTTDEKVNIKGGEHA